MLGEQGYIGLFLFLLLFFLAFRTGTWIIKQARGDPELEWASDLAGMLQVSLIAYFAAGAFLGLAYFDLPYHMVALLLLTRLEVEKYKAAADAPVMVRNPYGVLVPRRPVP